MSPKRTVTATYRLQLTPEFTFADAAALVGQLADLGISHLYLSPILEAVSGSTHGYDVTDPTRIRHAFGGHAGLRSLAAAAHTAGLGLVLDIVPNHVGLVSPENPWWWDVLTHGPDGQYGRHLDIYWQPGAHGQPTVLLPALGSELVVELAGTDLQLRHVNDGLEPAWRIVYHEHAWPVAPNSLATAGFDAHNVAETCARARHDRQRLAALLDRQHYRLVDWRRGNDELNYRRFFDIATLGAVRIEDPAVFADAHAVVLPLLHDGTVDGLRIDHPDGLADPVGYFQQLRQAAGEDAWLVVEKILTPGEQFRHDWPVDGTVGYEFADLSLGLHINPQAAAVFDDLEATLSGARIDRDALVDAAKRTALDTLFGAELTRLTALLCAAAGDVDTAVAREVLSALIVAWPVYRTYLRPADAAVTDADRAVINLARARVRAQHPSLSRAVERVVELLLHAGRDATLDAFVNAFQQLTGPVIAKGFEDTVLYRDTRYVAVNEVGGDPAHLGRSVGQLHAANVDVAQHRPATMLLSSSHDTKRSEDVRARLAVLSQDPDHWVRTVLELRDLAARFRGDHGPSPAHEHLAIQTAVGAWPIDRQRLGEYLVKAAREGKQSSNWLDPNRDYEADLVAYGHALVTDAALRDAFERAVATVQEPGWLTSLSMTLVKLASPGVPDIYQGCELWDLSLVDPDNRRAVDHEHRRRQLAILARNPSPETILAALDDGLPKLWLIRQALRLRAQRPELFAATAEYRALWARGARFAHVVAFARAKEVVAVAPVRARELGQRFTDWHWADTTLTLPCGRWRDVLTGVTHNGGDRRVEELLARFPVALLVKESPGEHRDA